jgi:hypothetical protein
MSDDFDLDEVTSLAKASPTRTQKKGDLQSEAKQRHYKKTGWWISSEGVVHPRILETTLTLSSLNLRMLMMAFGCFTVVAI